MFTSLVLIALVAQSTSTKWYDKCRPTDLKLPPADIDDAVRFPNGTLFVFSGRRVSKISKIDGQLTDLRADTGWPKPIYEVWPKLESHLTTAFVHRNQAFFIKVGYKCCISGNVDFPSG